ncbi:Crp/Fnr family transcriptional regulator [Sediminibacterium ginsengisoli]|uniref:cAMP-binding domain of CRP or a regulatory subunit of cAMP-dependent protein kinases n=1 Tax=Sediminibacterium ginsengisoli TaxID=413434 RepID=A0A1T4NBN3_9BACT|nr:cyclic nucleotide-binding domain-containing protein [Sediminibacterium ginsengisoli]SJZ76437.1 cAMP-binding domain of CRP or a regulatory subunit of cAMP-dependent protein kinases [Sediminibacterium ginsengisoli]
MTDEIAQLRQFTHSIHPLSEAVWEDFAACWRPFTAARKTLLTAAGDTEKYLYFVTEGVQRAFYTTESGKEATIVFSYPFSFSGVADSFLLQQPSRFYFETLTQSSFIRTSFQQMNTLMQKHHSFETFVRTAVSMTLAGVLERQIELQAFTAEQKFRALLKRSPHVLRLIPHKYLASYLGIDATNFSKLLGSVKL